MITSEKIVAAARSWRGTPYHHQASAKGVGCDCLGLIRGVWREVLGDEPETMPAYTKDWNEATGAEALLEAAERHLVRLPRRFTPQAGDIAVFRIRRDGPAKHAGILVSPSRMVHAQEGAGVVEVEVSSWWRRRIAAAFRFPDVGGRRVGIDPRATPIPTLPLSGGGRHSIFAAPLVLSVRSRG